jgi:transposase-like protein
MKECPVSKANHNVSKIEMLEAGHFAFVCRNCLKKIGEVHDEKF